MASGPAFYVRQYEKGIITRERKRGKGIEKRARVIGCKNTFVCVCLGVRVVTITNRKKRMLGVL